MGQQISEKCIHGAPPPCQAECPFFLDVRRFMQLMGKGRMDRAYRVLAEALVFPELAVHLCAAGCRGFCEQDIDLPRLEQSCLELARNTAPQRYGRLPPRNKRVAVIGGGAAGLACALRLSEKKYTVTVFERAENCGGVLNRICGSEKVQELLGRYFAALPCSFRCGEEICAEKFDEICETYDAVCLATGQSGETFGLRESVDRFGRCGKKGVFLCGECAGSSAAQAIRAGVLVSTRIEEYIKIGTLDPRNLNEQPRDSGEEAQLPAAERQLFTAFTGEEAVREAGRCGGCDCEACRKACAYMRFYRTLPPKLESDAMMNEHTQRGIETSVNKRAILSCAQCGKCADVCPEAIDTGAFLLERKKNLYENGQFPPAFHDYYLREMADSIGENSLVIPEKEAEYLFFPGCQLSASAPELTEKIFSWLRDRGKSGLVMGCCGVPGEWAGSSTQREAALEPLRKAWEEMGKPFVVVACPTCQRMLKEYAPEMQIRSIYELLIHYGLPEEAVPGGEWYVFDACAARELPQLRQEVRALAALLQIGSPAAENVVPDCCGMGGHIYATNPAIVEDMAKEAASRSDAPYLAYCMNCRNILSRQGRKVRHILERCFGVTEPAGTIHVGDQRRNRRRLRQKLTVVYQNREDAGETVKGCGLTISEGLLERMDHALLSEEDCREAVEKAESSGQYFLFPEGDRTVSLRTGVSTLWVRYRRHKEEAQLLDAYSHRVKILGAEEPHGGKEEPSGLRCAACDVQMQRCSVRYGYLGNEMRQESPVCPECGAVYVSRDIAVGKMAQVEMMLEDK